MTGGDEADRAVAQDVEDVDIFLARDAKNGLHALILKTADK